MHHALHLRRRFISPILFVCMLLCTSLSAQEQTVGLFSYDTASFSGYTLLAPMGTTSTFLLDNYGRVVHTWESDYLPNEAVYFLENGHLLRSIKIGNGGGFEEMAWDGTVIWFYDFSSPDHRSHHDIEPLPNGNVLILAREYFTQAEAVAAGRNPAAVYGNELWCEMIAEVTMTGPASGDIVWEWHLWDHLVQDFDATKDNYGPVDDHPELLDINFTGNKIADWIHANAIAYNADLDQIVIGSRPLCEIWVIDHSTSTGEAAGHTGGVRGMGGDILYRWGNPIAYRAGTVDDQKFYAQHNIQWIEPGLPGETHLLVFNNGANRPEGNYSTVEEIITPVDESGNYPRPPSGTPFGPATQEWIYTANPPESFFSGFISGAQRLPNGNTLVCSGRDGIIFEVSPEGTIVWEYINPVINGDPISQGDPIPSAANSVFRCSRYTAEYPGLAGRDLTPGVPIEIYPICISGTAHVPESPSTLDSIIITATITDASGIVAADAYIDAGEGYVPVAMFDDGHHYDGAAGDDLYGTVLPPVSGTGEVSYFISVEDGNDVSQNDPFNAPGIVYRISVSAGMICGDANGDADLNVGDAVFLISYVFMGGSPPDPLCAADANGDGEANVGDGVYIINYVFKSGAAPVTPCCR